MGASKSLSVNLTKALTILKLEIYKVTFAPQLFLGVAKNIPGQFGPSFFNDHNTKTSLTISGPNKKALFTSFCSICRAFHNYFVFPLIIGDIQSIRHNNIEDSMLSG